MIYCYECSICGKSFEEFRSVEERNNVYHCGKKADRIISGGARVMVDARYKDSKGTPIWFPKDGASYYDRALQKVFHTKKEKYEYMKENRLIMDGSNNKSSQRKAPEAGTTRRYKPIYA